MSESPFASIQLDFHSKVSLLSQLVQQIRACLSPALCPLDFPLPTVRALALQCAVNFNTVARAYRTLEQEGWLITRQGKGTFVCAFPPTSQTSLAAPQTEVYPAISLPYARQLLRRIVQQKDFSVEEVQRWLQQYAHPIAARSINSKRPIRKYQRVPASHTSTASHRPLLLPSLRKRYVSRETSRRVKPRTRR